MAGSCRIVCYVEFPTVESPFPQKLYKKIKSKRIGGLYYGTDRSKKHVR